MKTRLTKFFSPQAVLFMEFANLEDFKSHSCIEVIPVKPDSVSEIEIFFKKSIQDDISEWSENKKIIDT
jgi:hypothetical protein